MTRSPSQITYRVIGTIHSPFQDPVDMPIQPSSAEGAEGWVEVRPEYQDGLGDLEGFSHLILIYDFHRNKGMELRVVPFLDDVPRGVFATRAPKRPNPIGISVVRLLELRGHRLRVGRLDVLDGTPLLDIKPYVSYFDRPEGARMGWIEKNRHQVAEKRSDDRFQ